MDLKEWREILWWSVTGQIAYSLLPSLVNGSVFGPDQPVILHLLDIPPAMAMLDGVRMELEDLAYPLYVKALCTADANAAFAGAVRTTTPHPSSNPRCGNQG